MGVGVRLRAFRLIPIGAAAPGGVRGSPTRRGHPGLGSRAMTTFPPAVHHTLSGDNGRRVTGTDDPAGTPIQLAVHELGDGGAPQAIAEGAAE